MLFKNEFPFGQPLVQPGIVAWRDLIFKTMGSLWLHDWLMSDARAEMITGRHQYRLAEASTTVMRFVCGGCGQRHYIPRQEFWSPEPRMHLARNTLSNTPMCWEEGRQNYFENDPLCATNWSNVTCRECKAIMVEIEWGPQAARN